MRGQNREQERRRLLADDVRRLGGFGDFAVQEAKHLDAPVPEEVDQCITTWRMWAGVLADWARGGDADA